MAVMNMLRSTSPPQCPQQRRLSALSRSHALYAMALLIPVGVLHLKSQLSYTDILHPKSFEGTQAPHIVEEPTQKDGIVGKGIGGERGPRDEGTESSNKFDYTAFWEAATESALESLRSSNEKKKAPTPCPKVYVYDLPSSLVDETDKSTQFGGVVKLNGEKDEWFQDYLHKTHQYAFPSILEYRLRTSKECRTKDPHHADLFFAPMLPASKSIEEYMDSCKDVTGEMVRDALPYLNSTNACRHFFVIGKGHVDVQHCDGWFSNPIPELKSFSRLAYSNYSFVIDSHGAHRYDPNDTTNITYPNLASVPYPSSLHFRKSNTHLTHLSPQNKRKVLMSFVGKYNHGDTEVRERIHDLCIGYKDTKICEFVPKYYAKDIPKARATFCLEPAGDTPGRKSLSDSITFGCIPVLFSKLTDDVAPWFWLDWKERGRVLVPREEFVAGQIDLKELLSSIPPKLLKLMQDTLREKARKFQYSLDDDQDDGIRVILDNLHQNALDKEQRGVCGY